MSPRPPRAERVRSRRGWLLPATPLVLAPKCLWCLLAYAGLATVLGLGGPEMCGRPASPATTLAWLLPVGFAGAGLLVRNHRVG